MKEKKVKEKKVKEKTKGTWIYSLGNVSNLMSYLVLSHLTYALTQSAGMTALTVGTILLASRCFDGITDIIAAFIVDRMHFKLGKARPYEILYIPMWIFVIMCFSVPSGLSQAAKFVWVFLTYNMCQSVCYTMMTATDALRLKLSFRENARAKVTAVASALSTLAGLLVGVAIPILISIFENQPHGWTIITTIFAIPAIIGGLCRFAFLKEIEEYIPERENKEEKASFFESVKMLLQNKYALMIGLALLMIAVNNAIGSVADYYFTYIYGSISAAAIPSLIGSLALLSVVVLPVLMEKLGCRKIMLVSFICMSIGSALKLLMPTNLIWLTVCGIVVNLGVLFVTTMKNLALIDCMEYGKMKTGKSNEAIYASVAGISDKLGLGIGSFAMGLILQMGGFDGNAAMQTAGALNAIKFCYAGIPAVLGVIGFIGIFWYKADVIVKQQGL